MRTREWFVALALAALTSAVFWPVSRHGFIELDDYKYILENPNVSAGLGGDGLRWAFTSWGYEGNSDPLTWLSHMLDVSLYGLNPAGHHVTNLLLHMLNTVLLFTVLWRMTGFAGRSAFVAALFAVHPLHVESVAWVAERKDVLSAFFLMLTLQAYERYVRRPGLLWYVAVAFLFLLGLLAKPMLVTFPFVLLLLDGWPLGRVRFLDFRGGGRGTRGLGRCLGEKAPLLGLSIAASAVAYTAQSRGGALVESELLPLGQRAANAVWSYAAYVENMVWPAGLAVYYPHPQDGLSAWQVILAVIGLATATSLAIAGWRRRPYLAVGWLWYIGTLVPVIGLIQFGGHARADRFTYIPLIGLLVIIAWGGQELAEVWHFSRQAFAGAVAVTAACAVVAGIQVTYWQDGETLFRSALTVTTGNSVAHGGLGDALSNQGRLADAIVEYKKALEIHPKDYAIRQNLGNTLAKSGRFEDAALQFRQVIGFQPTNDRAYYALGLALFNLGRTGEAIGAFWEAVRINPQYWEAHVGYGNLLTTAGRLPEAAQSFQRALELHPTDAGISFNLGEVLRDLGRNDEARRCYQEALRLRPDFTPATLSLGRLP